MKTPSTRRPLRVFSSAAVEKRSANHVDVEDEQSVAVGNLDDDFRMPLDFFINARRIKKKIRWANIAIPPARTRFYSVPLSLEIGPVAAHKHCLI